MGRQERRKAQRQQAQANRIQKQADAIRQMKHNERVIRYAQNGITPEDVEKAVREHSDEARIEGWCCAIAAYCCALHDLYGYGQSRCATVTEQAYKRLMMMVDSDELVEEMIAKVGISIDFKNALEPITLRKVEKNER